MIDKKYLQFPTGKLHSMYVATRCIKPEELMSGKTPEEMGMVLTQQDIYCMPDGTVWERPKK